MDYTTLYDKYNSELRPLISEFEGREEQFEEPILKSMAYVVDELSLLVQKEDPNEQNIHLKTAQQHLEEAVVNSYKFLVYSHHRRLKKFRKRFSRHQMELFKSGTFIGRFSADSNKAKKHTRRAKKQKVLLEAKDDFKQAYELYSSIDHEATEFELEGAGLQSRTAGTIWTIVKMVLSVAASVGAAYCFSNCSL